MADQAGLALRIGPGFAARVRAERGGHRQARVDAVAAVRVLVGAPSRHRPRERLTRHAAHRTFELTRGHPPAGVSQHSSRRRGHQPLSSRDIAGGRGGGGSKARLLLLAYLLDASVAQALETLLVCLRALVLGLVDARRECQRQTDRGKGEEHQQDAPGGRQAAPDPSRQGEEAGHGLAAVPAAGRGPGGAFAGHAR